MLHRLHPILDSRRSVAECIHGAESLESGLLVAAMTKVLGHGDSDGVSCPREHRRCTGQPTSARRGIRDALLCMRCALEFYEVVDLGFEVGDCHFDAPYSKQRVIVAYDRNLDGKTAVGLSVMQLLGSRCISFYCSGISSLHGRSVASTLAAIDVERLACHETR
jgi:hypothetical protein